MTLTLASAVVGGETVVVSYDTPQTSPLTNVRGTPAGTLTNHAVDNVTNNDPVFTTAPYSFTVNENTRAVGTVLADDVDIQDTVGYRLTPATPPGAPAARSGRLHLPQPGHTRRRHSGELLLTRRGTAGPQPGCLGRVDRRTAPSAATTPRHWRSGAG